MEKHAHIPEALKPEEDLQRPTDSPLHHDAMARRPTSDSPHHLCGDRPNPIDPLRKVSRTSGGYDRSVEQSPLHPRNQARVSLEQKGSLEGGHGVAPNTPGRFKMRTGDQGDESPDKGPVVPRFGEWDENNPSSADNFTHIFNKVREEKQTGTAKVPISPSNSRYLNSYNQDGSYKSSSCCCFRWCKK